MKSSGLLALLVGLIFAGQALAADDPNIKGMLRANIKAAMARHIEQNQINGTYLMYDAVTDKLLRLKLDHLHDGVEKKGDLYVSCVDMRTANDDLYDIDLLVGDTGNGFRVLQSVVHEVNGIEREYHLGD